MASIKKFKYSAVKPLLRYCSREIQNPRNKDIDPTLSHKNYSLLPRRATSDYEYFLSIIHANDISYWHRADTVALVGIVISFPLSSCDEEEGKECDSKDIFVGQYRDKLYINGEHQAGL